MNSLIIKLFNRALILNSKNKNFELVNKQAVKLGYLIHPDICDDSVLEFINSQSVNYNSTFYNTWEDIIYKNRFELLIDQLIHYCSTYGTDFKGEPYIPNDNNIELPPLTNLKVILPITKEELSSKCFKMLTSGIALKQETIEELLIILDYLSININIDEVKNKEAKMFLYKKLDLLPSEPTEMVRYLVYLSINKTLLIKDKETLDLIKLSNFNINPYVERFGVDKLSSVFNRFKDIFLSFKKCGYKLNSSIVNKLRKKSIKNHKPLKIGYFENLLIKEINNFDELRVKLSELNNYKKILLLQTIKIRLKNLDNRFFGIRNSKLWVKPDCKILNINKNYLNSLYTIIYESLVNSLKYKSCKIKLPKGINLTLPTSEKSFSGNYPLGTSFDLSDSDNILGIYWREEDGARDLDLSLVSINGEKYGWNSSYYNSNKSIIYSGDMTSANPEAAELFYTSSNFNPCIIKINLFNGENKSKFKFFLAKEKINSLTRGYMVDPDNILFTIDSEMDSKEKMLGVISENKFILSQFRTGKGRISYNSVTDLYTGYSLSTLDCYVNLKELLIDCNFTIVEENEDLDLSNISKDSLINLLS